MAIPLKRLDAVASKFGREKLRLPDSLAVRFRGSRTFCAGVVDLPVSTPQMKSFFLD
jgi:hypothetical protein